MKGGVGEEERRGVAHGKGGELRAAESGTALCSFFLRCYASALAPAPPPPNTHTSAPTTSALL